MQVIVIWYDKEKEKFYKKTSLSSFYKGLNRFLLKRYMGKQLL